MRLADFIEANTESILGAAVGFNASQLPAAGHLDAEAMRDHMPMMLEAIVADLRSSQTAAEQARKAIGGAPSIAGADDTGAQIHALLRAKAGFQIEQVVAEYRALRASVLRLWFATGGEIDALLLDDVTRFNEAIDQAVAESVAAFSAEADRWRHIFLAVLGHDLRGPLNAVLLTAELLGRSGMGSQEPVSQYTASLIRSGRRMQELLDHLLDYSRSSLGRGIGITRKEIDLAEVCRDELQIVRAALPGRSIELETEGVVRGQYDASRMREVLSNLVFNAAKHSAADSTVRVRLTGSDTHIVLAVENVGVPIASGDLQALFEPLHRGKIQPADASSERASLGLGLFIVQEIARSHGGAVDASSDQGRTVFTVTVPLGAEPAPDR